MLAEVIKSIRETEGKGEETRRNAQAESRRIIQEAEQVSSPTHDSSPSALPRASSP